MFELDLGLAVYHLFVVAKVVIVRNFAFSDMATLLCILVEVIRFPSFTIIMWSNIETSNSIGLTKCVLIRKKMKARRSAKRIFKKCEEKCVIVLTSSWTRVRAENA